MSISATSAQNVLDICGISIKIDFILEKVYLGCLLDHCTNTYLIINNFVFFKTL